MGWTYFAARGRDTVTLLKNAAIGENEHVQIEWIDHTTRGSVVYAVIKSAPKGGRTPLMSPTPTEATASSRFS